MKQDGKIEMIILTMSNIKHKKTPIKSHSITSFFTTKGNASVPSTYCPVCQQPANNREINRHLDQGCPESIICDKKEVIDIDDTAIVNPNQSDINSPAKSNHLKPVDSLCLQNGKENSIQVTPKKSRNRLHFPSPTKSPQLAAKALFRNGIENKKLKLSSSPPTESSHIPLTLDRRKDPLHVPYYLTNFETVLRGVIEETEDGELFLPEELEYVKRFRGLTLESKKLYVRLFQRKYSWLQASKIKYDEISDNVGAANLLSQTELIEDNSAFDDLDTVLNLLSAVSLKILCKEMNFNVEGLKQRNDHIHAIKQHVKRKQKCVFSQSGADKFKLKILQKATTLLGICYKLQPEPRKVFLRIISLYSLTDWWDERENNKGGPAPTLTTILLKNTGKLVYPLYQIQRQTKIFPSRTHLLQFEEACTLETNFVQACEDQNFDDAIGYGKEAEQLFCDALEKTEYTDHASGLPEFLKKFTPGSILGYILSQLVDLYEKLKYHEQAVILLRKLIGQKMYLATYHGHWYERLCLDLDQHLKRSEEALTEAGRGLADPNVRIGRRLTLCRRIKQICNAKKNAKIRKSYGKEALDTMDSMYKKEFEEVVLQGRIMPKAPSSKGTGLQGGKSIFVFGEKDKGDQLLCSVEDFVKESYKREGYPFGVHAEGSVVNTIFTILFWDILYCDDIPDVFRTPHQSVPLDFDTDDFYANRKTALDERIEAIRIWDFQQLSEYVINVWNSYATVVTSSPANWDLFPLGVEQLLGLLKCFQGYQLSAICERLAKDHRHTRSGFPDLTVWNQEREQHKVAFIEVKGPNDVLSPKQILWLNFLTSVNISAFVCHVEALNSKCLRSPRKIKHAVATSDTKQDACVNKNSNKQTSKRKVEADDFQKNDSCLGHSDTSPTRKKSKRRRVKRKSTGVNEQLQSEKKEGSSNDTVSQESLNSQMWQNDDDDFIASLDL